jgi:hypothetical protein
MLFRFPDGRSGLIRRAWGLSSLLDPRRLGLFALCALCRAWVEDPINGLSPAKTVCVLRGSGHAAWA